MKPNSSYCCVILWFLLKSPTALAQAADDPALDPDADPYEQAEPENRLTERDVDHTYSVLHENALWNATIEPGEGKTRSQTYFIDSLAYEEEESTEFRSHSRRLDWSLGLGGGEAAYAEGKTGVSQGLKSGNHSLSLDLGVDGAYVQSGEFQTLDKQYSDSARAGDDIEDAPTKSRRTHRAAGSVRIADIWKVQPDFQVGGDANQRNDRYRVTDSADDRTRYSQLGLNLKKSFRNRMRWEASLRMSELKYESANFSQKQNLNESSTTFLIPLVGRYNWGFGYQILELRDTRALRGPSLTLLRSPDERLNWRATVSYLNGPGNEHVFGDMNGNYRLTRTQSLNWSAVRTVDLFSSYGVITASRLPLTAPQDSTLNSSLSYLFETPEQKLEASIFHSESKFLDAKIRRQSFALTLWNRHTLLDSTYLKFERRRNQESGAVFTETERNYLFTTYGWKHTLEGSSRLYGALPFLNLEASYESISDRIEDYSLKRILVLAGIGQAWN